jgi:hypothetical protein
VIGGGEVVEHLLRSAHVDELCDVGGVHRANETLRVMFGGSDSMEVHVTAGYIARSTVLCSRRASIEGQTA